MPESSNFLNFNSLQARIWLAVGILAAVNAGLAVAVHFAADYLFPGTMVPAIAAAATIILTAPVAGYWLSGRILGPIENVSLLAKSLERSPSASVPKTSGAAETDEILYSLHRNSRQITTLITLMDDVASGKTETALTPLENADKLSNSFQRLVSKVTDSIDAKKELDKIQTHIERLRADVQGIRHGSLDVAIRNSDVEPVREIADSVTSLAGRTNKIAARIKTTSIEARPLIRNIGEGLSGGISRIEADDRHLSKAMSALRSCSEGFTNVCSGVASAVDSVQGMLNDYGEYREKAAETKQRITTLRLKLADTVKGLAAMRERSEQINRAARTAGEIARRSNMIAVNTAIQANAGPHVRVGVSIVSEEMALLAERSEKLSRSLSSLEEQLLNDLAPLEASLKEIEKEIFDLTHQYGESFTALNGGDHKQDILTLPEKIAALVRTPQSEADGVIEIFNENKPDTDSVLRESERSAEFLTKLLEELGAAIADINLATVSHSAAMPEAPQFQNSSSFAAEDLAENEYEA